jgi:hypothetical protein
MTMTDTTTPPADIARNTPPPIQYVKPGETVTVELPWSEVCMSMRVAGRATRVQLIDPDGEGRHMLAQIFDDEGRPFSFPVLASEAGFYRNTDGWYCYPPSPTACGWTCTDIGLG